MKIGFSSPKRKFFGEFFLIKKSIKNEKDNNTHTARSTAVC